jgi:hypothetical protein
MTNRQITTASWAGNLPDNLSYLAPTQFELLVKKLPNTKYFSTGVNVPSVAVAEIQQPTNLGLNVKIPGDKLNLGENRRADLPYDGSGDYDALYSDMTIVVTTAANNPNRYIRIEGAFPTSLGEITMDTTVAGGLSYVTCTASFQFTNFEIASTS